MDSGAGDSSRAVTVPVLSVDIWLHQTHRAFTPPPIRCPPPPPSPGGGCGGRTHTPLPLLVVSSQAERTETSTSITGVDVDDDDDDTWMANLTHSGYTTTIVSIPLHELSQRSFELPPRDVAFVVLVEEYHQEAVLDYLLLRGPSSLSSSSRKTSKPANRADPQPPPPAWCVRGVILDSPVTRRQLRAALGGAANPAESPNIRHNRALMHVPRLWEPDPLIERHLLPFLRRSLCRGTGSDPSSLSSVAPSSSSLAPPREIWDLGAGVGRDVAFVAREMLLFLDDADNEHNTAQPPPSTLTRRPVVRVVGIDTRYNSPQQVRRCQEFWTRQGVCHATDCRALDLKARDRNNTTSFEDAFFRERPWCVYAVRFFHRPLLECISRVAVSGTVFAMSHFCKPSRGASWDFPHPKVSFQPCWRVVEATGNRECLINKCLPP